MLSSYRNKLGGGVAALALGIFAVTAAPATVFGAEVEVTTELGSAVHAGEFVVPLNKSQILRVDTPVHEILVGNSEIADVLALTDQSIYVLGQRIGSTNLTIYGQDRELLAIMDLVVSHDAEGLKAKLFEVMPDESIEVRTVNGAVLLTGEISSKIRLSQALTIAESYAPSAVTNGLTVSGSQQVMLQVRFAEIDRAASRSLGISHNIQFVEGDISSAVTTGTGADGLLEAGDFGVGPIVRSYSRRFWIEFIHS